MVFSQSISRDRWHRAAKGFGDRTTSTHAFDNRFPARVHVIDHGARSSSFLFTAYACGSMILRQNRQDVAIS